MMLFASLSPASSVLAQDGESNTTAKGSIKAPDADGKPQPVEGVEITVADDSGTVIATVTTDADGNWSVPLPGAGTYTATLNVDTLPDGVALREGTPNERSQTFDEGNTKGFLFPMGAAAGKADSTIKIVQLAVDGLKLGLLIAMCAIGLSLIYGTTQLVNFAHGEMVTFGGMMAVAWHVGLASALPGFGSSLIVAAVFAVAMSAIAGWLFNEFVWKQLRNKGASLISALVVSIGFSILFRYVILYFADGRALFYRDFRPQEKISFGIFSLAPKDIFIIIFSVGVLVLVATGLQRTRIGKAMRAVADNRDLAESSGIDVERVIRIVWIIGSALAGLGGVLFGLTESVGWEMGFRLLLLMFAGVTLGGLGTAYGALFGSLIVGVFIQVSTVLIPSDLKNVGALVAMIVILLFRPQGLLGRKERIG